MIRECQDCQVYRLVPRNRQQKLTPITSSWSFYKWEIDIVGPFPEGPGKKLSPLRFVHEAKGYDEYYQQTMISVYVISFEIGMPTIRTTEVDMVQNDEALKLNLDLLEEKIEQPAICEARSKAKIEKYYNSRLGPKWEGPYEVTKALDKGAYKLRDRNGKLVPRTWNIRNLKKCYVHEMGGELQPEVPHPTLNNLTLIWEEQSRPEQK
nr:reverse transcriptase domain-containing protein [Tanacetum cinerariifolium]